MVTTIAFWNTQHLSKNTAEIEAECARQLETERAGSRERTARRKHFDSRPVTRSRYKQYKTDRGQKKQTGPAGVRKPDRYHRAERGQMDDMIARERAEELRRRYHNKLAYAEELPREYNYVFYSEVMRSYPHWQNPLVGVAPTANTLGYYFAKKSTAKPLGLSPITAADVSKPISRYPKGVAIDGVLFFFWHAKAKQSYADVVAEVYFALVAKHPGSTIVLFGDLNAPPPNVVAQGVPMANILRCGFATHRGGKELD